MDELGLVSTYIKGLYQIIIQSYKGHITIAPKVTFKDYLILLENTTP